MKVTLHCLLLLGLSSTLPGVGTTAAADGPYHLLKEIPVGGDGGWDYLTMDSAAHRLYLSHGNVVMVVDTQKEAVVGQVDDTPGVHGFAVAPKLGRGFSSNGLGPATAIRGASERFVPLLMTASVTALGLFPLALGTGEAGREIEGPMAVVILGGLVTSALLNLLVLPTLALRFGRFGHKVTQ